MVEKTRVDGPPFGERAEPQERKERECVEKGSKGIFSGELMHRRKRMVTSVLDESISELNGSYA